MLLNELITITPKQLKPERLKTRGTKRQVALMKTPDYKALGHGMYASAYASEKDPGGVEKIANPNMIDSLKKDAYFQYISKLAERQKSASNVYFPKIFNLKVYRGRDGKYTYNVNIEKLLPLDSLSTEEISMIGEYLFKDFIEGWNQHMKGMLEDMDMSPEEQKRFLDTERERNLFLQYFCLLLHDCITEKRMRLQIKDPKLIEAVRTIKQVLDVNKKLFLADIHPENIMVRRGPFIPQIVFTDPVSHLLK